MYRTTKKDIENIAARISRLTGKKIFIEYAYGKPRAYTQVDGSTGVCELSPRLPKPQLADWLWAFEKGLTFNS